MSLWQLSAQTTPELSLRLCDVLEESFAFEPLSTARFEVDGGAAFTVDANYAEEPDVKALKRWLADVDADLAALSFTISSIEETGWVEKSLAGLSPVQAGRFFVYGSHDAGKVPPGSLPLLIEAGEAFGTGHHGTTEGCLTALTKIAQDESPTRILDLGTGTGILGIGAAKLWNVPVWASDIDPIAVEVAEENARLNGVGPLFRGVVAGGVNHPALRQAGPFDLIIANILARPLRQLAPQITSLLAPGGLLVLSGILDEQALRVDATYRGLHIHSQMRLTFGEWVTLVGRKARRASAATILD